MSRRSARRKNRYKDEEELNPEETHAEDSITFSDDDLESLEELPENMERMGDVFYDPVSGRYYIIENKESEE